jgi:hypothetical protein
MPNIPDHVVNELTRIFHKNSCTNFNALVIFINAMNRFEMTENQITYELEKNKQYVLDYLYYLNKIYYDDKKVHFLLNAVSMLKKYKIHWTEIIQVLNSKKSIILVDILTLIKDSKFGLARKNIYILETYGVTWSELNIIRKSLDAAL